MATILVLDDRATNRDVLVTLLGYAGYTTLEAQNAEVALNVVRAARPNLVIADVLMPDIDGFAFVRMLRSDPSIASTPVMFYTATYIESETHSLAASLGVSYLLTKPAEPQVILDTIRAALDLPIETLAPPPPEQFEQEHQRLLLHKLSQKVDELEAFNAGLATINAELEERIAARTAELAEANQRLRDLNAVKDNLLAITSHDLRSPLGAIQNMAELLLDDETLNDDNRRLVTSMAGSASRLIAMVSTMLDLSKLEAGKVQLEPIELRASAVTHQVLDSLLPSAKAKHIDLLLEVLPKEPTICADWVKLAQILSNLLSNAIKFTPSGGQVRLIIAPAPSGVCISVADNGMGIPSSALPHLFEQFRQVHTRGTAGERGSGLGLAIVRQLVALHGGIIDVDSTEGAGSVFSITLPAKQTST
jgi:signal transduction histidine kinase